MSCAVQKDCDFYNIVSPFVTGKIENSEQLAMIEQYRSEACGKETFDGKECPFYGHKVCGKYPAQHDEETHCDTLTGRTKLFIDSLLDTSLNTCLLGKRSCRDKLKELVKDPKANAAEIAARLYGIPPQQD